MITASVTAFISVCTFFVGYKVGRTIEKVAYEQIIKEIGQTLIKGEYEQIRTNCKQNMNITKKPDKKDEQKCQTVEKPFIIEDKKEDIFDLQKNKVEVAK